MKGKERKGGAQWEGSLCAEPSANKFKANITHAHMHTRTHTYARAHTHKEGSRRMGGNKLNKRLNCLGMVSKRVSQHLKSAHTPISRDARAHIIQLSWSETETHTEETEISSSGGCESIRGENKQKTHKHGAGGHADQ